MKLKIFNKNRLIFVTDKIEGENNNDKFLSTLHNSNKKKSKEEISATSQKYTESLNPEIELGCPLELKRLRKMLRIIVFTPTQRTKN